MADFVSKALVTVDYSGGQVQLDGVTEFSVEAPKNLTAVKTMNRLGRVRGYRGGPAEPSGSLTIPIEMTKELDWFALWRSGERFLMSFEEEGSDRFQLPGTRIDNVSRSYNAEGEAQIEVSFMSEDLIQIPD